MRKPISEENARQEVIELTQLMRDDSDFHDIREALNFKGLSPADSLLAGLVSGEDGSHFGALIIDSGRCILFKTDFTGTLVRWEPIEDISVLANDFDAIAMGIDVKINSTTPGGQLAGAAAENTAPRRRGGRAGPRPQG